MAIVETLEYMDYSEISSSCTASWHCIHMSFGLDENLNLRTCWIEDGDSRVPKNLASKQPYPYVHLPRLVIYHAPTNPKPEQELHRMLGGGNCRPGCCGEAMELGLDFQL